MKNKCGVREYTQEWLKGFSEKLNANRLDWCYNCASSRFKSSKAKMFTWIVVQLMRSLPDDYSFDFFEEGLCFTVHLEHLKENDAIVEYLHKKSFWKLLIPLVDEHLTNSSVCVKKYKLVVLQDWIQLFFTLK